MENYATRGLRSQENQPTWFCGRVAPGRERAFERGLRRFQVPTYFPVHNQRISRSQWSWRTKSNQIKQYTRERPLFPGYVFAELREGVWQLIRERVAYKPQWLDFGGGPVPIPVELIEDLRAREDHGFVQLMEETLHEGDEVEITEGVWYGRRGILASDPDRRVLTLHLIAESYSLEPSKVLTRLRIDREHIRLAN